MTGFSRMAEKISSHLIAWRIMLIILAIVLALLISLGPLSPQRWVVVLLALAAGVFLLDLATRSHKPVEWALLGFLVLMPATRFSVFEGGFSLQANFVLLVVLAGLLIWRAGWAGFPLHMPRSSVNRAILVLFGVICLSALLSFQVEPGAYRGEVRFLRSAKQIAYLSFMLVTYVTLLCTVKDRRLFKMAIWTYVGISFLIAIYGLYQFIAYPLNLPYIDLFPESATFGASVRYTMNIGALSLLRVWSVASEPTWFGDYLVGIIPLTAALALSGIRPAFGGRLALPIALVTMVLALLLTFARSAYLALIVGSLVLILIRPRLLIRALIVVLILALLLVAISLLANQLPFFDELPLAQVITERFLSPLEEEHFGNIHRATAAAASWDMFRDRPWGVGYGNYGFFFYDYKPAWGQAMTDRFPDLFPVMSGGIFLRLLTETSVPGVIAFLWLVWVVVREAWQGWSRGQKDPFIQVASLGLMAGFLSLIFRLAFFGDSIHFTYQWFIIALIVAAGRLSQSDPSLNGNKEEPR